MCWRWASYATSCTTDRLPEEVVLRGRCRDGELQALKVSEDVVEIDEFAIAESLFDGESISRSIESLALQQEISLLVRRSPRAPFVGDEDAGRVAFEWMYLQTGGGDATGFEGA